RRHDGGVGPRLLRGRLWYRPPHAGAASPVPAPAGTPDAACPHARDPIGSFSRLPGGFLSHPLPRVQRMFRVLRAVRAQLRGLARTLAPDGLTVEDAARADGELAAIERS